MSYVTDFESRAKLAFARAVTAFDDADDNVTLAVEHLLGSME
jgi:hypothetical protein